MGGSWVQPDRCRGAAVVLERGAGPRCTWLASPGGREARMRPCGLDLRERIVKAYENGEGSVRDLAERFDVAPKTVQTYLTLYRTTGSVAPRPRANGPRPKIDGRALNNVRSLVATSSDATLDELADQLARRDHIVASRHTVGRALRRLNITRKKSAPCSRARHGRGDSGSPGLRRADRSARSPRPGFH
ncbi:MULTISPECIES: helix-turn-helix domain-containing protein [Sorangium]|uniref:helix-turn-helix domain-containing protein n=1 Tax=Sorangium TaxID=39643 RepID=UPI003D9C42F2